MIAEEYIEWGVFVDDDAEPVLVTRSEQHARDYCTGWNMTPGSTTMARVLCRRVVCYGWSADGPKGV